MLEVKCLFIEKKERLLKKDALNAASCSTFEWLLSFNTWKVYAVFGNPPLSLA